LFEDPVATSQIAHLSRVRVAQTGTNAVLDVGLRGPLLMVQRH